MSVVFSIAPYICSITQIWANECLTSLMCHLSMTWLGIFIDILGYLTSHTLKSLAAKV